MFLNKDIENVFVLDDEFIVKELNKKKKEDLDKGLEKTKQSVFSKLSRAIVGKSKVDDEVLDNLEEVLVTSDVGVTTTLKIIERIEARVSKDKYVDTKELNSILKGRIIFLLTLFQGYCLFVAQCIRLCQLTHNIN